MGGDIYILYADSLGYHGIGFLLAEKCSFPRLLYRGVSITAARRPLNQASYGMVTLSCTYLSLYKLFLSFDCLLLLPFLVPLPLFVSRSFF